MGKFARTLGYSTLTVIGAMSLLVLGTMAFTPSAATHHMNLQSK